MRVFISLPLPEKQKASISRWIESLRGETKDVRWVAAETLHITLKFCGECDKATIEKIKNNLNLIESIGSFELSAEGINAFPNFNKPNIIWLKINGDTKRLLQLQSEVEDATAKAGIEPERHPFKAHLTLGRVRREKSLTKITIEKIKESTLSVEPWIVSEMALMKSELYPTGPIHKTLRLFKI